MFIAGLALILVGWLIQMYLTVIKKDVKINPAFLGAYAAGCVLLTVGSFTGNDVTGGILNGLDVIIALTILVTILVTRKTV